MARPEYQFGLDKMGYVRQPTISKGKIAFVVEEDIWLIDFDARPQGPKLPRRMTTFNKAAHPLLSPSATHIAFSDSSDLWLLTVEDGRCRQLTWFAMGDLWPAAWSTDTEIVFASTCEDPFDRSMLYKISINGGEPTRLFEGEYDAIAYGPRGGVCVGRHTKDTPRALWKGYRGGQHGFLWIDVAGAGVFAQIDIQDPFSGTCLNISCMTWQCGRLFFIADPDGSGNIWSTGLDGQDLQKHTTHDFFDVRCMKGDQGDGLVYVVAGELWHFNLSTAQAQHIKLDFGQCNAHRVRSLEASEWVESVALHPDGHTVSCLCRGNVYEMALWSGPAVQLLSRDRRPEAETAEAVPAVPAAVRCVALEYLASGQLLTASDNSDSLPDWTFVIHPAPCTPCNAGKDEAEKSLAEMLHGFLVEVGSAAQKFVCREIRGQIESMSASPVHDAMLIVTSRNQLWLMEFVSGGTKASPENPFVKLEANIIAEPRLLDTSEWEQGISDPCWSPDGEWISYCHKDSVGGSSIVLMNLQTLAKTVVADATFSNTCPAFHPDGLYLAFLSARHFAPLEDDVTTDLTFASGAELPFLVLLSSDAQNPLVPAPIAPAKLDEDADCATDTDSTDSNESHEEPMQVRIDVDNIDARVLQLPVSPGHYSSCAWTADGKLMYLREKMVASSPYLVDDEDEPDTKSALFSFDFGKLKEAQLWENVMSISTSPDGQNMLLCVKEDEDEEEKYFAVKAGLASSEDEEADMSKPGPESRMLDMDRLSVQVVDVEEWRSMFLTICEFVSEHLFDDHVGGVDWTDTCNRYQAILPRVRSSVEFEDLCGEMLSELGLSHVSFTLGSDDNLETTCKHLGILAFWQEFEGGGAYRVDEVLRGDIWDSQCSGPVARPGVGIMEGALILAVNRKRVSKDVPIGQMLAGTASSEVFITYVPADDVPSFAKLQRALSQNGGVDGIRQLHRPQVAKASKKNSGKPHDKRSAHGKRKNADKHKVEDFERQLAALFKKLDISTGHVWRTARVCAAGEAVIRNVRMRDLIEARRREVHKATGGRVGYVYVPDTTRLGFAEFYRCFAQESSRDALIIDLRCNNGGFASELFLKQLQCRFLGWTVPRPGRVPTRCPELCTSGAHVLLVDENTCSDGEAFAEAFQRFGLGTVVGVRTWGGVIAVGAADLDLLDGSRLTLPDSHYFIPGQTGYSLENRGVAPDITSVWPPDCPRGVDPQLSEAILQSLKLLPAERGGPKLPSFPRTRLHRRS